MNVVAAFHGSVNLFDFLFVCALYYGITILSLAEVLVGHGILITYPVLPYFMPDLFVFFFLSDEEIHSETMRIVITAAK